MDELILKRFETPDEVREMPKGRFEIVRIGSEVIWVLGCLRMGKEPLLSSEKDMKSFRSFLEAKGIKFVLVPSG